MSIPFYHGCVTQCKLSARTSHCDALVIKQSWLSVAALQGRGHLKARVPGNQRRSLVHGLLGLLHVIVLSGVRRLVLEPLEHGVDQERQNCTGEGADPVDPVVVDKAGDDGRPEGASRVDRCSGPVCGGDVRDEHRDADADGGQESRAMLFDGEEVHRQDQLGGEQHLDEEALGDGGAVAKRVVDQEGPREDAVDDGGGSDAGCELGGDNAEPCEGLHGIDEQET